MKGVNATKTDTIKLTDIRTDGGTQTRAAIQQDAVSDYAEALEAGDLLPPVTVYHDGTTYWLADGFHRYAAQKKLGATEIAAEVRQGARRDAVLHSVGANATHGLRRTNEDKRRAVQVLLEDEEWSEWSDREISRRAGVGNKFVGDLRRAICVPNTDERRVKRGESEYTMQASKPKLEPTQQLEPPRTPPPVAAPPPDLSEYTRERYSKSYNPPPLPEPEEDDDELLDDLVANTPDELDEPEVMPYTPPGHNPTPTDLRVKPDDPSRRRPFMRAFTAAGALSNLSDDVIVDALLSPENRMEPTKESLELEFQTVIEKINRCLVRAEQELKTVTV